MTDNYKPKDARSADQLFRDIDEKLQQCKAAASSAQDAIDALAELNTMRPQQPREWKLGDLIESGGKLYLRGMDKWWDSKCYTYSEPSPPLRYLGNVFSKRSPSAGVPARLVLLTENEERGLAGLAWCDPDMRALHEHLQYLRESQG